MLLYVDSLFSFANYVFSFWQLFSVGYTPLPMFVFVVFVY